jgi:hypothetical protein
LTYEPLPLCGGGFIFLGELGNSQGKWRATVHAGKSARATEALRPSYDFRH